MTAAELMNEFLIRYDIVTNFEGVGYEVEDIDVLLNTAQHQLIHDLVKAGDLVQLKEVIFPATVSFVAASDLGASFYAADLSSLKIFVPLSVMVKVSRTFPTVASQWFKCNQTDKISIDKYVTNSTNKPFFLEPLVYFDKPASGSTTNRVVMLLDAYTVITGSDNGIIEYIGIRTDIDIAAEQTSVLNSGLHRTIVDMAVQLAANKPQPA